MLEYDCLFFDGELDVRAWLGMYHEHGGVDSSGDALWDLPEVWFKLSARKGPFTIWWAVRNPRSMAELSRVEGLELPGYEELLSIRWNFIN